MIQINSEDLSLQNACETEKADILAELDKRNSVRRVNTLTRKVLSDSRLTFVWRNSERCHGEKQKVVKVLFRMARYDNQQERQTWVYSERQYKQTDKAPTCFSI